MLGVSSTHVVVWGAIIGGSSEEGVFLAKDWGLLIMNYVLLNVIRFFLLFSFFPLIAESVSEQTGKRRSFLALRECIVNEWLVFVFCKRMKSVSFVIVAFILCARVEAFVVQ